MADSRGLLPGLLIALSMSHALANDTVAACKQFYDNANYTQALHACSVAAEAGDANAQTLLGEMYDQGLGVTQSAVEARKWWRAASTQDFLPAQNLLALKYYYGGDVFAAQPGWTQDYQQAFQLWSSSANKGAESSQYMLGEMYMLGQGVERDYAEAYAWFQLALSSGYKLATDSLIELSRKISPQQKKLGQARLQQLQQAIP